MKIPMPNVASNAAHSEYGPSGSKRWMSCPASTSMIRSLPKRKQSSNFFAEEGTAAHELGEHCLNEELKASACIGQIMNKTFEVDKEMAKQVQKYIDYVTGQETWESQLMVEARLSLEHIQKDMFGTADAVIVSVDDDKNLTSLEVIDLKYGRGVVVEAKDNTQLQLYACGVVTHLLSCDIKMQHGDEVQLTIVQPRAPHKEGPIRSTTVTIADLIELEDKCRSAVMDAESDNPSFGPGEDQCMWCEFAPQCRANAEFNLKTAGLEWEEFTCNTREFKENLAKSNTLTGEEIARILKHSKALIKWAQGMADHAITEMSRGEKIPGWKLVYGRSNRQFSDQKKVMQTLLDNGIEKERLFGEPKFKSPAQMEKELNEDELEYIQELIIKPQGNITLAVETDGRKAVDPNQEASEEWDED